MSEDRIDYLADIAERDQQDGELEGITTAVARHFRAMIGAGMSEYAAVQLCLGFQHDLMGGDNVPLLMVGGDDE
jgi:hypothetical protein